MRNNLLFSASYEDRKKTMRGREFLFILFILFASFMPVHAQNDSLPMDIYIQDTLAIDPDKAYKLKTSKAKTYGEITYKPIVDGARTYYYPTGRVCSQGIIKNGMKEGTWTFWEENGTVAERIAFVGGKKDGLYEKWDSKGIKRQSCCYKNDLKHGDEEGVRYEYQTKRISNRDSSWFDTLYYFRQYEYGKEHGISKETFSNGQVASITYYSYGKARDSIVWYRPDGLLAMKDEFREDCTKKYFVCYFPGGNQLKYYQLFDENGKILESYEYHPNGKLKSEKYSGGKHWLASKSYYENGQLKEVIPYDSLGKENGVRMRYYANGQLRDSVRYLNDLKAKQNYTEYHENGKILQLGEFLKSGKHGTWKEYYENGKLRSITNYSYGNKEGDYRHFFINGRLSRKGQYAYDKEDGKWVIYHKNGKWESKLNFVRGKMEGARKMQHDNGKKAQTGYFLNGSMDGEWVEYDYKGKWKRKTVYKNGQKISEIVRQ